MKKRIVTRWKRPLAAALGALLVLSAVCGAGSALPKAVTDALPEGVREVLTPVTAQAASGDKAIVMGTASVLGQTDDFNNDHANTQIVHYGGKTWYVIGYNGTGVAAKSGTMTLISVGNLKGDVQFRADYTAPDANHYSKSALKGEVDVIAGAFIAGEKAAVQTRTLEGGSENQGQSGYDDNKISGDTVNGALLWPLSVAEANVMNSNLRQADLANPSWATSYWWLRSPGHIDDYAALVDGDGRVSYDGHDVSFEYGLRPAFYLNLNSVLFSSAAAGGKSSGAVGADALKSVGQNSGNEWKLTLKDASRSGFFARTMSYNSGVLEFCYRDAKTGANEFVSVIVTDSTGATIKQYGRVVQNSASGTATVNLSGKLDASDKVFAYSEQYHDDNKTDYASELRELSLTSPFAPSITTTNLLSGTEGAAYTATLAAGGTAPITWNVSGLPAGLTFDSSTGEISGTPTENGTFNVSVTATNTGGDDTKQLTLTIDPASGPAPTPTPAQNPSDPCATGHATYHWITVRAADEHNDGEMVYRCSSCGHERYRVPISGYSIFSKNTMQKILDAPQGATISVSTRRWISFHRMVYQALADRPDVTLKVSFLDGGYRGNRYSVTIPAGYDTLSLLNGTDYCGFLYLGSKFGLSPGE